MMLSQSHLCIVKLKLSVVLFAEHVVVPLLWR